MADTTFRVQVEISSSTSGAAQYKSDVREIGAASKEAATQTERLEQRYRRLTGVRERLSGSTRLGARVLREYGEQERQVTKIGREAIRVSRIAEKLRLEEAKAATVAQRAEQERARVLRTVQQQELALSRVEEERAKATRVAQQHQLAAARADEQRARKERLLQQQELRSLRTEQRLTAARRGGGLTLQHMARRVAAAVGVYMSLAAAGQALSGTITTFADFERRMDAVATISRDAGQGHNLDALTEKARELGRTTEFTAIQVAEAEEELARVGFGTAETLAALEPTLNLATIAQLDLQRSAEISSNTLRMFGRDASEAERAANVYAVTAARTATDVDQLFEGMRLGGPVAASLGLKMEQAAAALGVLADSGLKATIGGTQLRGTLAALVAPTTKARRLYQELGIDLSKIDVRHLADSLDYLRAKGVEGERVFAVFGRRMAAGFNVLSSNTGKLRELEAELRNTTTAANDMAADMRDNLRGSLLALKSAAESFQLDAGTVMSGDLRSAVDDLTLFLRSSTHEAETLGKGLGAAFVVGEGALTRFLGGLSIFAELLSRTIDGAQRLAEHLGLVKGKTESFTKQFRELGGAAGAIEILRAKVANFMADTVELASLVKAEILRLVANLGRELGQLLEKAAGPVDKALMFATGGLSSLLPVESNIKKNAQGAEALANALDVLATAAEKAGVSSAESFREIASERTQEAIRISNQLLRETAGAVESTGDAAHNAGPYFHETGEELEHLGESAAKSKSEIEKLRQEVADAQIVLDWSRGLWISSEEAAAALGVVRERAQQLVRSLSEEQLAGLEIELFDGEIASAEEMASALVRALGTEGPLPGMLEELRGKLSESQAEAVALLAEIERIRKATKDHDASVEFWTEEGVEENLSKIYKTWQKERKEAEKTAQKAAREQERGARKVAQAWEGAGRAISESLRGIDATLGQLVASLFDAAGAWRAYQTAKAQGDRAGQMQAGFAIGSAIGGVAGTLGLTGGGVSSFGGQMSGNYLAEGAQLGGTFFGPLGALFGAALGSFFEKAADTALVVLEQSEGAASARILQAQGGLAELAQEIAATLDGFVAQVEELIGAHLDAGLADLSIRVEDEIVTVGVRGLVQGFRTLDEALSWAGEQLLAANDSLADLGQNMRQLFEGLGGPDAAGSFEELRQVLDLAARADGAGGSSAETYREIARLREVEMDLARRYGLVLSDVIAITDQRLVQARQEVEASRNQLLGVTDRLSAVQEILAAMEGADRAIEAERAAREARIRELKAEAEALEAVFVAVTGGEGVSAGRGRPERDGRIVEDITDYSGALEELHTQMHESAREVSEVAGNLRRAQEEMEALSESLAEMPESFSAQDFADTWNAAAAGLGTDLIRLLRQVRGAEYAAAEERLLQTQIYQLSLAGMIQQTRMLLDTAEGLSDVVRGALGSVLTGAQNTLQDLAEGKISFDGQGGGRGGRREFREQFRRELAQLQAAFEGVSEGSRRMQDALRQLREDLAEAAKNGVDAATRQSYRVAQLGVLAKELLAPFQEALDEGGLSDFEAEARRLEEQRQDALASARLLAEEIAAATGRAFDEVFDELAATIDAGTSQLLANAVGDEAGRLAAAGDAAGVRALLERYGDVDGAADAVAVSLEAVRDELDASLSTYRDLRDEVGPYDQRLREIHEDMARFRDVAQASILDPDELAAQLREIDELEAAAVDALYAERRAQLEQATQAQLDAARLIDDYGARLRDSRLQFDAWRAEILEAGYSAEELTRRLDELAEAEAFAARSISLDFLQELERVGVEVPGLAVALLELQRASLLAELAVLATDEAFLQLLADLGTSVPELLAGINTAIDQTIAGLGETPKGEAVRRSSGGASTSQDPYADLRQALGEAERLIASWSQTSTGRLLSQAREIRAAYEEAKSALDGELWWNARQIFQGLVGDPATQTLEELQAAYAEIASSLPEQLRMQLEGVLQGLELDQAQADRIQQLFEEGLTAYDDTDVHPLQRELDEIIAHFDDLAAMVDELGLGAERLAEVEAKRQEVIAAFWERAYEGVRSLHEELTTGELSGASEREDLARAQARFEDLQARLAANPEDLEALAEFESAARAYLSAAEAYDFEGNVAQAVHDQVLAALEAVLGLTPPPELAAADPPVWMETVPPWWDVTPPWWGSFGPDAVSPSAGISASSPRQDAEAVTLLRIIAENTARHRQEDRERWSEEEPLRRALYRKAREETRQLQTR